MKDYEIWHLIIFMSEIIAYWNLLYNSEKKVYAFKLTNPRNEVKYNSTDKRSFHVKLKIWIKLWKIYCGFCS